MKLYEFEGHKILKKVGITCPFFVVVSNVDEAKQARRRLKFPIIAKVQVLSGRRGKSGGIKTITTEAALVKFCKETLGRKFPNEAGEEVRFVQLAQKVDILAEHYISITYDTVLKIPFFLFSEKGGMDVEEIKAANPEAIVRVNIDPTTGPAKKDLEGLFRGLTPSRSRAPDGLVDFGMRLWDVFRRYDCRLVEVNPLALVSGLHGDERSYVALDAKVILDDAGISRHKDLAVLPKGAVGALPSERELAAKQIDAEDYRGTAGSKFIEFGGDIAILASGGGASLLVMDALFEAGAEPANYTEYSGNPPREKVEKLTKIALSREGLSGCLVAGAVANFTDIFETLSGFCEGLLQIAPKPLYPIVIRRGGPRQKEAYEMLVGFAKKHGFDIYLFGPETPISVACRKMVELSENYKGHKS